MYQATIYVENSDGKIEKLSQSFDSKVERNTWLMSMLQSLNFSYLIANGDSFSFNSVQS